MSPNSLQLAGATPAKPSRKAPIYQGARWTTGLWSNRGPIRDAASTRLEEKFYGPRGDSFLGGENLEISQRLTVIRRPGNSVWNSNTWTGIDSFYEFRLFNSNIEEIKTIVDTKTGVYDASNNGQALVWTKNSLAGQSFFQSVGNILYWGDGVNQKKWIQTLQKRIQYVRTGLYQNPYNFTPFELNTFFVDPNGDAEQLIGTVLQLDSFYILNNEIIFTLKTSFVGPFGTVLLPLADEVLTSGLQVFFPPGSQIATLLGEPNGITLTIDNVLGGIETATVDIAHGGTGYIVGDTVVPVFPQSVGGQLLVTSVGTSGGTRYINSSDDPTSSSGIGVGCTLNLFTTSGVIIGAGIFSPGAGYKIGDILYISRGVGGFLKVLTVNGTGGVLSCTILTGVVLGLSVSLPGAGYITAPDIPTTGGHGTGLVVDITTNSDSFSAPVVYDGGPVSSVTISNSGTGYFIGDVLTLVQPNHPQPVTTPATVTVTNIQASIASIALTNGGPVAIPYAPGITTYTTSGTGIGASFTITTVSSGLITGVSIGTAGSGFAVGDAIYLIQGSAIGAVLTVATLTGTGIATVTVAKGGNSPYTVAANLPTTTSGIGTGATVDILGVSSGRITLAILHNAGTGYSIGDQLYPTQPPASGAILTVASLNSIGGPIVAVSITNPGIGYVSENNISATGGHGTGAVFDITVANPSFLPPQTATDTPDVFSGGNPISDSRLDSQITWATPGNTTIDGSALWFNRGPVVDGGLVYNWGIQSSPNTPRVVVNNAESGWAANTYYNQWKIIIVTVGGSQYVMQIVKSGVSGAVVSWNIIPGQITTDGTAQWLNLGNDGDTTLAWVAGTKYSVGHVLINSGDVFQLKPYSGVRTQDTDFPVYCWQCNNQNGSDVGAAGELPSGGANTPMAPNGGQTTTTATYSGTMNSLFLTTGGSPVRTSAINGEGVVSGSPTQLFPTSQNLSISMLPSLVIPEAGIYTFQIGHQNAMFWGIGKGSVSLNVINVQVQGNILTITSDSVLTNILSTGIDLSFKNIVSATFLNGQTVTVATVLNDTFTAQFTHASYGPSGDTGVAFSESTLTPSVISGPLIWAGPTPNIYNFDTGTPIKGYPIISANYPTNGGTFIVDTVQVSFPSAGVYPAEIQQGFWYHSIGGYSTPVVSPVLPGTTFGFYMVYSPPNSSIFYNIIPDDIATSSATPPVWPPFPATVPDMQLIAPNYPSVIEASGNYTWWNIGPVSAFSWNASVNYTTSTFIIDQNSNEDIPYVPGVSGTTVPVFSNTLYGLAPDVLPLVWMNNGPVGQTPSGTLETTQGGWKYVVALVNTLDDTVSNASSPSVSTGNFFGASSVFISGGLPNIIDPQADYVAIFRTDDGGAIYYLIPPPASGNGNTEYTLPLAQYLANGFTDTTPDSGLNTLLIAPIIQQNTPPKIGSINPAFKDNRIFVSVGNTVYWSTGPDTPIGNGFNGFYPGNFAEFPSKVTRLVPLNIGMLVFTISDIYIISGNGTAGAPFTSQPVAEKLGLLSYNALTLNGSVVYFFSTDKQILVIDPQYGFSHSGTQIADVLQTFSSSTSYLTWHVSGSFDQCLFVSDGSTGWYRMSPTAAPEAGSPNWSLKANIIDGAGAVQSIETTPGNILLLIAPPPSSSGPILFRDYTTNTDNGTPYPANFILGSLVLAYPGQVADVEFITIDCLKVPGSRPISLGIRVGEISGAFEPLNFYTNDPPQLPPSSTLYNQRFYLSQTKEPAVMRHLQLLGQFEATDSADELYTLTVFGGWQGEG